MKHAAQHAPPAPPQARGVFADTLDRIETYASLLASEGIVRGLIGPREVPRLWERHLLNCGVLSTLVPEGANLADVGTGAGLPGLVLAISRPDVQVALVEPLLRRTTFLSEVVDELGLGNVRVVRARAEELHEAETFSVVTSRAVAPLDRLCRWSLPLVASGGSMLGMKGSSAHAELDAAAGVIAAYGGRHPEVVEVGHGAVDPPVRVVRIGKR